jgi:hypothetical protein
MLSATRLATTRARLQAPFLRPRGVLLVRWATTESGPGFGASGATGMELETTDPLELYRGLCARGQIKPELEQIRALVQVSPDEGGGRRSRVQGGSLLRGAR